MATYGFLFWATTGHGTPGANESVVDHNELYPTTYGNGATAGYLAGTACNEIDEATNVDYRLTGTHYTQGNAVTHDFKVDITGSVTINSSNGDHGNASGFTYSEFFDNTTSLAVVVNSASGQASNNFWDATGVKRTSAADWVTNQASVVKTVSTHFKWRLGKSTGTGATYWNYLKLSTSVSGKVFSGSSLNGLGAGGPFFHNRVG